MKLIHLEALGKLWGEDQVMLPRFGFMVGVAILLLSGTAFAQEPVLYSAQGPGGDGQFIMVPNGVPGANGGGLFLEQLPAGATNVHGFVNGLPVATGSFVELGFDFIQPLWSFRDFNLVVPGAFAPNFPILGDTGHVNEHFAFAPHINLHYQLPNSDFGLSASGSFLNLTGNLQRDEADTNGGTGHLNATANLTIVAITLAELTRRVYFADVLQDCGKVEGSCLDDLVVDLSIGARYASVDQSYTGQLTDAGTIGSNIATRQATESFKGFGGTLGFNLIMPAGHDWLLFSNTRLSVLAGDNVRHSAVTVTVANAPGFSNTISDDRTSYVPVVESEMGIEWGVGLADKVRARSNDITFTVKLAGVFQYWGDVGPLSAGSTQGFRTNDLYLVGGNLLVGIHR
jgi:hypothetical protein